MVYTLARHAQSLASNLINPLERTDTWLANQLSEIWNEYFEDIRCLNRVEIRFAREWKNRLGMIRLSESGHSTYIGINGLLRHLTVPEAICLITIAHELVHYAHGFGSPHPRRYRHPHHGNVVSRELVARGLGNELQTYKSWTARHWYAFYEEQTRLQGCLRKG